MLLQNNAAIVETFSDLICLQIFLYGVQLIASGLSVPIGTELLCSLPASTVCFMADFGLYWSVCSVENHRSAPDGALMWASFSWGKTTDNDERK